MPVTPVQSSLSTRSLQFTITQVSAKRVIMSPPTHTHTLMAPWLHLALVPGSHNKLPNSRPSVEERAFSSPKLDGHQPETLTARPSRQRRIKRPPKPESSPAWETNVSFSAHSTTHGKHQVNMTWNSIGYDP